MKNKTLILIDLLKILEILLTDKNFKNLSLNVDNLYNCKNVKDLINLFEIKNKNC